MLPLASCAAWVKSRKSHCLLILHIPSKMEMVLLAFPGKGSNICWSWVYSEVTFRGICTLCIFPVLNILGHKEHARLFIYLNPDGSNTFKTGNGQRLFTKGFIPLHWFCLLCLEGKLLQNCIISPESFCGPGYLWASGDGVHESTVLTYINMQYSVPFARMLINT